MYGVSTKNTVELTDLVVVPVLLVQNTHTIYRYPASVRI
jgi:hypothetical protein